MTLAAVTLGHSLLKAGLILDVLLAAEALCSIGRARRVAVAGALVLSPLLLAAALWKSTQVLHLRHHALLAVVGILVALLAIAALAGVFRSRPRLLALCAVFALPFRFSVISGGSGGVLLVLYAVIGAGALALVIWNAPEVETASATAVPEDPEAVPRARAQERPAGWLERAIALFIVLYAIAALYTPDLSKAAEEICFFYVPFALLFVMLRRVRWDRALIERCARLIVALALLFVVVAAVEYTTAHLLFHADLDSNQRFFRVNSLFYDPNIYGRFLALTMVAVAAAMMWETSRRRVVLAAAVLAVLWLGLLGSVSQSSIVALLAGLAVIAGLRFSPRAAAACAALVAIAAVVVAVVASGPLHLTSANNATSGRASLVREGLDLFADRPIAGFGAASFSCEYLRHTAGTHSYVCGSPAPSDVTSDSHTTPVTVAAEQGVIGLAAYVALLVAAILTLARGGLRSSPVRVAVLAAFVALVVHTWAYADFLEDPITWALLAVGAALARE
ncbi:MAG: O-antigen ligase family protein [Solirubrobacteraceae bacterium]